jgi:hypothetical protein
VCCSALSLFDCSNEWIYCSCWNSLQFAAWYATATLACTAKMCCHKEWYLHAAVSSLLLMPIWLQGFPEPGLALMSQDLPACCSLRRKSPSQCCCSWPIIVLTRRYHPSCMLEAVALVFMDLGKTLLLPLLIVFDDDSNDGADAAITGMVEPALCGTSSSNRMCRP